MGVVLCLLVFLSREEELDMWMWVSDVPLLFLVLEKPSEKSVSSVVLLRLVFLEKDVGVGVLHLLLVFLNKIELEREKKVSSMLLWRS